MEKKRKKNIFRDTVFYTTECLKFDLKLPRVSVNRKGIGILGNAVNKLKIGMTNEFFLILEIMKGCDLLLIEIVRHTQMTGTVIIR